MARAANTGPNRAGGLQPIRSSRDAARYHEGDFTYVSEDGKAASWWLGKTCVRLGLEAGSVVDELHYRRLLHGKHPTQLAADGHEISLRARQKEDAVHVYEQTLPAAKAVSLLSLEDNRIHDAVRRAAATAHARMERYARVRDQANGRANRRVHTGELCSAAFLHATSRGLEPHLHVHLHTFAVSHGRDGKPRTLDSAMLFEHQSEIKEVFHAALGREMVKLGYRLNGTAANWSIEGISDRIQQISSSRSADLAKAKLVSTARLHELVADELVRDGTACSRGKGGTWTLGGVNDALGAGRQHLSPALQEQVEQLERRVWGAIGADYESRLLLEASRATEAKRADYVATRLRAAGLQIDASDTNVATIDGRSERDPRFRAADAEKLRSLRASGNLTRQSLREAFRGRAVHLAQVTQYTYSGVDLAGNLSTLSDDLRKQIEGAREEAKAIVVPVEDVDPGIVAELRNIAATASKPAKQHISPDALRDQFYARANQLAPDDLRAMRDVARRAQGLPPVNEQQGREFGRENEASELGKSTEAVASAIRIAPSFTPTEPAAKEKETEPPAVELPPIPECDIEPDREIEEREGTQQISAKVRRWPLAASVPPIATQQHRGIAPKIHGSNLRVQIDRLVRAHFESRSASELSAVARYALERLPAEALSTLGSDPLKSIESLVRLHPSMVVTAPNELGVEPCTTKAVLAEERLLRALARAAKDTHAPIPLPRDESHAGRLRAMLNTGQRNLVDRILQSRDGIFLASGPAGSGKSTMGEALKEAGKEAGVDVVFHAANISGSRRNLRAKGHTTATTTAKLLLSAKHQKSLTRDTVLVIDEAGLLGAKTLNQLLALQQSIGFKLVLLGDIQQCVSPERGDAMRQLAAGTSLDRGSLRDIVRQKGDALRGVCDLLKSGRASDTTLALRRLQRLGGLHEANSHEETYSAAAAKYIERRAAEIVTPLNWDLTRKRAADSYRVGQMVSFEASPTPEWQSGSRWRVARVCETTGEVFVARYADGQMVGPQVRLEPRKHAQHFSVACVERPGAVGIAFTHREIDGADAALEQKRFALEDRPSFTTAIRDRLKAAGEISTTETSRYTRLVPIVLETEIKREASTYRPGHVLVYSRTAGLIEASTRVEVTRVDAEKGQVYVRDYLDKSGPERPLNQDRHDVAEAVTLHNRYDIELAKGDLIRLTGAEPDLASRKVDNGSFGRVVGFEKGGVVVRQELEPELVDKQRPQTWLFRDSGFVAHGYVTTPFVAQSLGADPVLVADKSSAEFAAQMGPIYVAISRALHEAHVFLTKGFAGAKGAAKSSAQTFGVDQFIDLAARTDKRTSGHEVIEASIREALETDNLTATEVDEIRLTHPELFLTQDRREEDLVQALTEAQIAQHLGLDSGLGGDPAVETIGDIETVEKAAREETRRWVDDPGIAV